MGHLKAEEMMRAKANQYKKLKQSQEEEASKRQKAYAAKAYEEAHPEARHMREMVEQQRRTNQILMDIERKVY